jgi:hypothetical protein
MKRSGSEKRQATELIAMRFKPKTAEALRQVAEAHAQSLPALVAHKLLDAPLPRVRRPRINDKAMARFLSAIARSTDAVYASLAEFGKVNSNVNQIAHHLNAGRPGDRMMNQIEAVLQSHIEAKDRHDELIRDMEELRSLAMKALGLEPDRDSD